MHFQLLLHAALQAILEKILWPNSMSVFIFLSQGLLFSLILASTLPLLLMRFLPLLDLYVVWTICSCDHHIYSGLQIPIPWMPRFDHKAKHKRLSSLLLLLHKNFSLSWILINVTTNVAYDPGSWRFLGSSLARLLRCETFWLCLRTLILLRLVSLSHLSFLHALLSQVANDSFVYAFVQMPTHVAGSSSRVLQLDHSWRIEHKSGLRRYLLPRVYD